MARSRPAKRAAKSPPATGRWTFDSTSALVDWMEDEYLSEVVLDDVSPTPGKPARTVRFTWWLYGTGGPSRVPYQVEARDVTRWTLVGAREGHAIGFSPPAKRSRGSGVRIEMTVPGKLTLECRELAIVRGKKQRLPRPKKHFTTYSYFHVYGRGAPSAKQILSALGAPPGARAAGRGGDRQIMVRDKNWVEIYDFGAESPGDYHWNVVRGAATDDEWHRALEMPFHVRAREVHSAWEFVGPPDEWLVAIGAPPRART
jgi:hypothetical protein